MTNGDVVAPDDDFLDDQPDDALALKHIQILHLGTQALEEFAQRMCEPQVGCLVAELIIKRPDQQDDSAARRASSGQGLA